MAKEKSKAAYLDVCALSRPFDDQTQLRIRVETESIQLILSNIRQKIIRMISSPVHDAEIEAINDTEERNALKKLLDELAHRPNFDLPKARQRADDFTAHSVGVADAAHLSFAEQAEADLVTVDDRFIKRAKRAKPSVWIGTPLEYCEKEKLK
jgi:predicted nucleic acid-binding protein